MAAQYNGPVSFPFRFAYLTSLPGGDYGKVIGFNNAGECSAFILGSTRIKEGSAEINAAYDNGRGILDREFRERIGEWLNYCYLFIEIWGHGRIPQDIRNAVNSAEQVLHRPRHFFRQQP